MSDHGDHRPTPARPSARVSTRPPTPPTSPGRPPGKPTSGTVSDPPTAPGTLPPGAGGVPRPLVESAQAPAWAMAAQAIDARDQTHLRRGLHLRIMTSPLLGLPITPFRVLDRTVTDSMLRDDVVWTDPAVFPRRLHPPFEVTPERPAIGWLPPATDATCAWLEVDADVPLGSDLRLAAMVSTSRGPRPVASRSSRPYQVWASAINHVVVEGNATINGARWLPSNLDAERIMKLTALPVDRPHRRHASLDGGVRLAAARVTRGAPQRRALHDVDGAPPPFAAQQLAIPVELARVGVLSAELHPELLRLVDEPVLDPWLLTTASEMFDERGEPIGTSSSNCLDAVFQASLDHGLARWLGYLDNDLLEFVDDSDIAARVVTAVFAPDWAGLWSSGLALSLPPAAVVADIAGLRERYPDFDALGDLEGTLDGPFLDLGVMAAYTPGLPSDPPPPPVIASVTDRPTRSADIDTPSVSAWVPGPPGVALRGTRLVVGNLTAGAVLALARDDLAGDGPMALNEPSRAATFREPLVAGPASASGDGSASSGTLDDRRCPAGPVRYHVAQADWFGRWSDWSTIELGEGIRPAPPTPIVRAWTVQPERPSDPDDDALLAAEIFATIAVPGPNDLAPGSNLLRVLRFQVTDASNVTQSTDLVIDDPAAPPAKLDVSVTGPALARGTSTSVRVSAYWIDTASDRSAPSPDITLTLWDPRPPHPVTVDQNLKYSSRPDVTGRAWVELTWPAATPQERFRVYYADETTLSARVADVVDAAALLTELGESTTVADRAATWTRHGSVLPRDAFTMLTPEPIARTGASMRFEHAVSGSLRTLSLYRIVAVSGANVDVDFDRSPILPVAVPNAVTAPQPHLAVRVLDPALNGGPQAMAELTITVPRGTRRAVEYRLRRSRVSSADLLMMPIVATGPLHPPDDPHAAHVEVVVDAGPTTLEPDGVLRPWSEYTWRVEVRGEPELDGPPAAWSSPSAPVGAGVVPLEGPPAPTIRSVRRGARAVRIAVDPASELRGGTLGSYAVELYRQLPDGRERLLATIAEQQRPAGSAPWLFVDDDPVGGPPAGTGYRAVVVDPLGRRSPPSAVRSAP